MTTSLRSTKRCRQRSLDRVSIPQAVHLVNRIARLLRSFRGPHSRFHHRHSPIVGRFDWPLPTAVSIPIPHQRSLAVTA